MSALRELRRHWERFGREDPFWATLTCEDKRGGGWSEEDFFRDGELVVGNLLERAARLGIEIARDRALDFGCGPGRLTQALAAHFEAVVGVDIARSMIARARSCNRHGERCRYHVNRGADLRRFEDAAFTFVCSLLVLQHMKPAAMRGYLKELMRVLAPGGLLVFQVPSYGVDLGEAAGPARQRIPRWPLQRPACRARIRPASELLVGRAGERVPLRVEVENAGNGTWPCLGRSDGSLRVWLGGHLALPGDDRYWRFDAMRAPLSRDLGPGERLTIEAWLVLPEEDGDYLLDLDMVQEHVCWFQWRGSQPALARCRVAGGSKRTRGEGEAPRLPRFLKFCQSKIASTARGEGEITGLPQGGDGSRLDLAREHSQFLGRWLWHSLASRKAVMEMYGLARADVRNLVAEAGCHLLEVDRQVADNNHYEDCHFWILRQ